MELLANSMNLMPVANQCFEFLDAPSGHNALHPGQKLKQGHSLHLDAKDLPLSEGNPRHWTHAELIMQHDGNLVFYITYDENKKVPVWKASGQGCYAELNKGQLVVITGSAYGPTRSWCSNNWKEQGACLLLEEHNGTPRLALYNDANHIVWASDVNGGWWYDNTPW